MGRRNILLKPFGVMTFSLIALALYCTGDSERTRRLKENITAIETRIDDLNLKLIYAEKDRDISFAKFKKEYRDSVLFYTANADSIRMHLHEMMHRKNIIVNGMVNPLAGLGREARFRDSIKLEDAVYYYTAQDSVAEFKKRWDSLCIPVDKIKEEIEREKAVLERAREYLKNNL
jgi:hypothetical protein